MMPQAGACLVSSEMLSALCGCVVCTMWHKGEVPHTPFALLHGVRPGPGRCNHLRWRSDVWVGILFQVGAG